MPVLSVVFELEAYRIFVCDHPRHSYPLHTVVDATLAVGYVAAATTHDERKVISTAFFTVLTVGALPVVLMSSSRERYCDRILRNGTRRRRTHEVMFVPFRTSALLSLNAAQITKLVATPASLYVSKACPIHKHNQTHVIWKQPCSSSTMFLHLAHCCHLLRLATSMRS